MHEDELVKAARYLLKWANRECKAHMKGEVVRDIEKLEWVKQVQEGIGSMLFNLQKLQEHASDGPGICGICAFNLENDIEWLEGLIEQEQEKVA
jgi:hypothetical protein